MSLLGPTRFTGLKDVPSSYVGQSGLMTRVNSGETGLEFSAAVQYANPYPKVFEELPINWTKHPSNPLITGPGAGQWWCTLGVAAPSLIKVGETYYLYCQGASQILPTVIMDIGLFTSNDLINWTPHIANPVLARGAALAWDDEQVSQPYVFRVGDTYYMLYEGYDGAAWNMGLATSPDGIVWTKEATNPVFSPAAAGWDNTTIGTPYIIRVGATFYLYYHGNDGVADRIGLAYSYDLLNWTREPTNPLIDLGAAATWDDTNVGDKCIMEYSGGFIMIYEGDDGTDPATMRFWRLGLAFSNNLLHWTKYANNPILNIGAGGEWDDYRAHNPDMIRVGNILYLFYTGCGSAAPLECAIGLATGTL